MTVRLNVVHRNSIVPDAYRRDSPRWFGFGMAVAKPSEDENMPVNVVRRPAEEIAWERAKARAREEYPNAAGARFYRIVSGHLQEEGSLRAAYVRCDG